MNVPSRRDQRYEGEPGGNRRNLPGPEVQRLERDSFILLQHAYAVTGSCPGRPVNPARLGAELGFDEEETSRLVNYLSWIGYLKESTMGPHLFLANEGIEYLEAGAGRRRTVRVDDKHVPLPLFISR
ncbi:MAG TPA: hypothetical protein VF167_09635 [Longimicrobiaceae bacterium]